MSREITVRTESVSIERTVRADTNTEALVRFVLPELVAAAGPLWLSGAPIAGMLEVPWMVRDRIASGEMTVHCARDIDRWAALKSGDLLIVYTSAGEVVGRELCIIGVTSIQAYQPGEKVLRRFVTSEGFESLVPGAPDVETAMERQCGWGAVEETYDKTGLTAIRFRLIGAYPQRRG